MNFLIFFILFIKIPIFFTSIRFSIIELVGIESNIVKIAQLISGISGHPNTSSVDPNHYIGAPISLSMILINRFILLIKTNVIEIDLYTLIYSGLAKGIRP